MTNDSSASWKIGATVLVILGCLFWAAQTMKRNRAAEQVAIEQAFVSRSENVDLNGEPKKTLPMIRGKQKNLAIEAKLEQTRKNIAKTRVAAKSQASRDSKKIFTESEVATQVSAITSQKSLSKAERAIAIGELRDRIWISATPAAKKKQLLQMLDQKVVSEGPPQPTPVPFIIKPDGSAHMTTKPK